MRLLGSSPWKESIQRNPPTHYISLALLQWTTKKYMEILHPSEVQIICLASNSKSALDLRQTRSKGSSNHLICPLCKHSPETTMHLFAQCRYSSRVWKSMAYWSRAEKLKPPHWAGSWSIVDWWTTVAETRGLLRKVTVTILILITWEIWKERNARIFHTKSTVPPELPAKIKEEGRTWSLTGASVWSNSVTCN